MQALPLAELAEVSTVAVASTALMSTVLGFAGWKFWAYSQLEYITASMLNRWVPRDGKGARVIQLSGGTRELYYYPKNLEQVTVVAENVNKGLVEQAGMQALVPTVAKQQSPANLGFQATSTADAVVSLGAMAGMSATQRAAFLLEALRVLKPGRPLIFLERVPGGLPLRHIGTPGAVLDPAVLNQLKQDTRNFANVEWDIALEGQDPYAVGVAFRSERAVPSGKEGGPGGDASGVGSSSSGAGSRRREAAKKSKDPSKGFTAPAAGGAGTGGGAKPN